MGHETAARREKKIPVYPALWNHDLHGDHIVAVANFSGGGHSARSPEQKLARMLEARQQNLRARILVVSGHVHNYERPMLDPNYLNWFLNASLPAGALVQFKFIKIAASGSVTWENGANQQYSVRSSGTGYVTVNWQY